MVPGLLKRQQSSDDVNLLLTCCEVLKQLKGST